MKKNIVNFLKYNKMAYSLYYYIMSLFIKILGVFIKINDKVILFNSFAGRKYDDSPKEIYEAIKNDPRFNGFHLVWAFHEPDKYKVIGAEVIKTDSFKYFKTALSAKAWITNSSIERGLRFKKRKTFYLNTWHGSPIKKMGSDISANNQSFGSKGNTTVDIMNTQSYFEADIFSRCFGIPRNNLIEVGLPRNDILMHYTADYKDSIRKKLGLPLNKRVILYCPTFREYEKDENYGVVLAPPINLKKWEKELENEYVLLFRAHYEVSKVMNIEETGFLKNVTDYGSLNDLMIISDILISDYSSIFFDYSIMDKCMIYFTYDYTTYEEKRGMYFDIRDYLSGADSEDKVISIIKHIKYSEEVKKTQRFRNQYMDFYGEATKKTVDCIAKHIL